MIYYLVKNHFFKSEVLAEFEEIDISKSMKTNACSFGSNYCDHDDVEHCYLSMY